MNAVHLTTSDFVRQPWKNGGGTTTQLAREEGGERWLWRLSLAEVERSGPFSDFDGYERTLLLVEGEGMELTIEGGASLTLREPYEALVFDGGARVACRLLGGPVKDLNLIVDRRRARTTVEVIAPARCRGTRLGSRWVLAYALRGATRIAAAGLECTLAAGELLRVDDARDGALGLAAVDDAALLALVRIDPK